MCSVRIAEHSPFESSASVFFLVGMGCDFIQWSFHLQPSKARMPSAFALFIPALKKQGLSRKNLV
jgi:hypothetical protein